MYNEVQDKSEAHRSEVHTFSTLKKVKKLFWKFVLKAYAKFILRDPHCYCLNRSESPSASY